jgi:hypothetical protein
MEMTVYNPQKGRLETIDTNLTDENTTWFDNCTKTHQVAFFILNGIDDAIPPLPHSVTIPAGEFFTPLRSWVTSKRSDTSKDLSRLHSQSHCDALKPGRRHLKRSSLHPVDKQNISGYYPLHRTAIFS